MDRNTATKQLRELMDSHGLKDWKIRLSNDPRLLGYCSYGDKAIIISSFHVDTHPEPEITDTFLHEIAHALVGKGHGHNPTWVTKAREIGVNNLTHCSTLSFDPQVIDAIRSGATVEVSFTEETIQRQVTVEEKVFKPKYTVTQVKALCPICGKPAIEKFKTKSINKDTGDETELITLQCFHIISRKIPKGTPFDKMVSNDWKPEIKACKHEWGTISKKQNAQKNKCIKCGEFKLFDFQVTGARFIERAVAGHKGSGCFDEMGLGKTVQALSVIKYHPEYTPTLYVVKKKVTFQWFKEIIRWLGPSYLGQIISTGKDSLLPGLKTYIISFDLVKKYPPEKMAKLGIKCVVIDECQQIANVDSARTQSVRKLVGSPEVKIIPLSGSPWKNRGSEFFPVLNIIDPIRFYSRQAYLDRWIDYALNDKGQYKEAGIKNPFKFKEYISDIVIRRERKDVMSELPLINRTKLNVKLDDIEQDSYDDSVSDFVAWYNQAVIDGVEEQLDGMEILAKMSRMRHLTGLAKIGATVEYATQFFEEMEGNLVIGVHHLDVAQILMDQLKKELPHIQVLSLGSKDKGMAVYDKVEKFNSTKSIVVCSILAAGEGIDGLQKSSNTIIVHERQWNPANEEQFEARLCRIGQEADSLNSTYTEAEGTIDEHFDSIVEGKRILFHSAMNEGKAPEWNQDELARELAKKIVSSFRAKAKKKSPTVNKTDTFMNREELGV